MPAEGDPCYVGLRLGDSDLGLIADAGVDRAAPQRVLLSPPSDMPWGQRVVHLQDPDGNPVNLVQDLPRA